jgi:hypothetical protein
MHHRTLFWVGLAAALLVGVACSAAGPDAEVPSSEGVAPPQQAAETPPQPVGEAAPAQPQTGAEEAPADAEAQPAPAEPLPGRPDAPAPVEADFRSDPASVVAATGNPQLLEFFTYW